MINIDSAKIKEVKLCGNDMFPILFNIEREGNKFNISIPENNTEDFHYLVSGSNYELTLELERDEVIALFYFPVNLTSPENECLDKYRNKNSKLNKYMIGFKQKKPWYEIYLKESKIEKLPIIKNNNNSNNNIKEFNTPLKVKSSSNLKARTTKKKASRLNIKI